MLTQSVHDAVSDVQRRPPRRSVFGQGVSYQHVIGEHHRVDAAQIQAVNWSVLPAQVG